MVTVFLKKFDSSYSATVKVHHISEIINGRTSLVPINTLHFLLYVTEKDARYFVYPHGNFSYMLNGKIYSVKDNESFMKFYSALESALIDDALE